MYTNQELVLRYKQDKLEGNDKSANTIRRYMENLNGFIKYIGNESVVEVKRIKVIDYKNLCQKKYASSTVNNIMTTLTRFYDFIVYDLELSERNIVKNIDRPKIVKEESKIPTNEQVRGLLDSITDDRNLAIATVLFETGMRIDELLNITLETYNSKIENGFVILGKGRKYRDVFLCEKTIKLIDKYIENRVDGCEYLFTTCNGNQMARTDVSRMLKTNARKCGLFSEQQVKELHPHLCRHTCASRLINNDTPIEVVADALGHSSTEVTYKTYYHADKARVKRALLEIAY